MRVSKTIITLIAAVLAFAMVLPGALAAGDKSAEAGKTTKVVFTFEDVYNADGTFTVDDPQKVLSTYSISVSKAGATAATVIGNRLWAFPSSEPTKTTISVAVSLRFKSSAPVGSQCTVSFKGIYGDANEVPGNEHEITRSYTVTVKESPAPTPTPTPTPKVDYTELQKQIDIAGALNAADYTDESRDLLAAALSAARNAMESKSQDTVTAAAEVLRTTVAGLVPMDYTRLQEALTRADALLETEQEAAIWQQISDTAEQCRQLLGSGDQQAVDQTTEKLAALLGDFTLLLEQEPEVEVVIQEVVKEVPVEVLPSGDYCNIEKHFLWPVLFITSAAVNVVFIVVIVGYVVRKTKNRRDDTPLVDYDIDDDF